MAGPVLTLADLAPPALVDGDRRLSSDEVRDRADRIAAGLAAQGIQHGDVVAFWLPTWWEAVALYAACWSLGAVAAPLHHRLALAEAEALVRRLGPRAILVGDGLPQLSGAGRVRGEDDLVARWLARPVPAAEHAQPGDARTDQLPRDVAPDDLAVLLATSGSSGRPKLVRHRSGPLAAKGRLMAEVHGLTADDVVLMPAPLAHVSGLLNGILVPAAAGMTTVLMERWEAAQALQLIEAERVSFLIGPPTYFVQLMAEPSFTSERVRSVRLISCGGAGVTAEFAERAATMFGAVVKRTYGSTEAPTATTSYAGDPVERGWWTDGRPVGDVEVRLGPNDELHVRGSEVFDRYADEPGDAGAPDADGWFATGDRAVIDDGWVTITGRLREVIIRGGENVDPREVETVCASLPGAAQVVVVGYPDDVLGERVGLVVVGADLSVDAVRTHCAAAGLARFKTPDRVIRVDDLPVLTVGKPDRAALSALVARG